MISHKKKLANIYMQLAALLFISLGSASAQSPAPDVRLEEAAALREGGKYSKAILAYQEVVQSAPLRSDSWLALGELNDLQDQRLQAFLCYARFLTLESNSDRSAAPAKRLWTLLGAEKKKIVATDPSEDEGPWWEATFMMAMVATTRQDISRREMNDAEFFAMALEGVTIVLGYLKDNDAEIFWKEQVIPFFETALEQGHTEAMAFEIRQSVGGKKVSKWLSNHERQVQDYRKWNEKWKPGRVQ